MKRFKNKHGMDEFRTTVKGHHFCPLGKQWYDSETTVHVSLEDAKIPEFVSVAKKIKRLNDDVFTIEELTAKIHSIFAKAFETDSVAVICSVNDGGKHFPVTYAKMGGIYLV